MAIVFVHSGYSPYLEFSLRQARTASPDSDIILLGDATNDRFPGFHHVDLTAGRYASAGAEVGRVYCHRSTNRRAFEVGCFQRWFALSAFLDAEGLDDALVLDSDILLYASEAELRQTWLEGKSLGLCVPTDQADYRWIASPHVSYWTRDRLEAFTTFVLEGFRRGSDIDAQYDTKWTHHLAHGLFGGVVDMTALYLFWQTIPADARANFVEVNRGMTCDLNVNDGENLTRDEYAMRGGIKAVRWEGAHPTGDNRRTGEAVTFQALHFQGKAKEFIPAHYRGPSFPRETLLRARLVGEYKARRAAAAVLQPARLGLARLRTTKRQ